MRSILHVGKWLLVLIAASGLLAGCGGGGGGDAPPAPPTPPAQTGTVSGLVVSSASGAPLAGATVRVGAVSTTSAADGRYTLAGVAAGAALVEFSATDHARSFANATVVVNETARADARLTPVGARATLAAASGGTVGVPGTPAQVVLPAAGLVDRNGAAFNGPVTVELTPIDPAADPGNMPGELSTRSGNTVQPIESFGALAVTLQDAAGNRLNLASGRTATIRIPLATRSPNPPATVPLFFFDESAGTWKQEGTATLAGTAPNQYYEGTVTHFTFWNADQVTETIFVRGCVQDLGGARVRDAEVESEGIDYTGSARVRSNANGEFELPMRRNGRATITATLSTGRSSNAVVAGPAAGDITLQVCLAIGNGAPVFVVQPQSQSAAENGFVALRALAKGDEPLRYRWQRNGVDVAGATASVLVVSPLPAADNGARYRAVATNALGSATSDEAVITVQLLPPAFARQPAAQTVVVGGNATFSVELAPQGQPVALQWLRNGGVIPGATQTSYTLAGATLQDDGARFSVRATNPAGDIVSSEATLTVSAQPLAPTIGQQPADVSVSVGQAAVFSVVASGTEPLAYQWRRNGVDIANATGASYTLSAAAAGDDGARFAVRVSNAAGSVTSREALLTVTQGGGGAGRYLVSEAGAVVAGAAINFANGAQTFDAAALVALNTANPGGGLVTLEQAGRASRVDTPVLQADVVNSRASDVRVRFTLYFKDGRLYRIDQAAAGTPLPQLVSSLTSGEVCGTDGKADSAGLFGAIDHFADPTLAWVALRAPGADGQCNTADDRYRAVRMNMAAGDAAPTVGEPLAPVYGSDGALQGLIVREGNLVRRLDGNLANASDLFTLSGGTFSHSAQPFGANAPGVWVFRDGNQVFGYELAGGGAPVPLATLSAQEQAGQWSIVADGDEAFLALPGVGSTRLLRITRPLAASPVGTAAFEVNGLHLTPTRLVLSAANGIHAVARSGGTPQLLVGNPSGVLTSTYTTGGENVYYSRITVGTSLEFAIGIIASDGSAAQVIANAFPAGFLAPPTLPSNGIDSRPYAIIIAEGINAEGGAGGATLRAIEAATRNPLVTYGTLPATPAQGFVIQDPFTAFHWGQSGFFVWQNASAAAANRAIDLFFFDSDQPGLQRLSSAVSGGQATPGAAKPHPARALEALKALKALKATRARR